ncbi:MAG: sugar-binding transcriptional regulator [Anaerofustis sp.]
MDLFSAQRLVGEDAIQMIYERYQILDYIKHNQPAGRRKITEQLNLPERQVRNHLDYLYKKNIILIDKRGVLLNENAEDVTPFLYEYFAKIFSSYEKEMRLQSILGVKKVLIARGNSDKEPSALNNLGLAAESYFTEQLDKEGLIAVSGGTALKAFADNLRSIPKPNYTVVPVRGAIGSSHSYQANTIAFYTSMKLKCDMYELNIPDTIDTNLILSLANHPDIKAVTQKYKLIDILIFGVGRPEILAEYRHLSGIEKEKIVQMNAVAEAVGYYLNQDGEVIKKASGIGLELDDLKRIPVKIAVAGGASKAKAIKALSAFMKDVVIITDEGCADVLLK